MIRVFFPHQSNIRLNMVFKFYMPITGEIIKVGVFKNTNRDDAFN